MIPILDPTIPILGGWMGILTAICALDKGKCQGTLTEAVTV